MRILSTLALSAALLYSVAAPAQSLKPDEILSSITVQPVSEPNPVLGTDDRVHLAYELVVNNPSRLFVELEKIEAVDGSGKTLASLDGDALAAMMTLYGGTGRMLSPGGTAIVFMDVRLPASAGVPDRIAARITASRQSVGADGKPAPLSADMPLPAHYVFTGGATAIGKPAVRVAPPLRGSGWIAFNGCCDALTSHRAAAMAVNGTLRVPERFAIDWVKLGKGTRLFTGDGTKLQDYAYYGTPVLAVADGVVVNLYDGADEQAPNQAVKGITPENIGGNMLVIDIGGGAYAFYAHLQRGSLKVKQGDHVKTGDVIGLLGNTGNSTAPHLHFHIMDGPSPLDANGLPFVFTHFSGVGVLAPGSEDEVEHGKPAKIDPRHEGDHMGRLPLNEEVVDFGPE